MGHLWVELEKTAGSILSAVQYYLIDDRFQPCGLDYASRAGSMGKLETLARYAGQK